MIASATTPRSRRHATWGLALTLLCEVAAFGGTMLCARDAAAADRVTMQLQWDHQFQFAGYYAALWQGYYANAGIDVVLVPGVSADGTIVNVIDEVVSGRADFGVGSANLLVARDQGKPVVMISPIFQQSAVAVFARAETELTAPADLMKLRFYLYPNSVTSAEIEAMLRSEGLDTTQIPRSTDFSKFGLEALQAGQIDAVVGFSLDILWTASKANMSLRRLRPAVYGVDFYGDSLFTREDLAQSDPDLVRRFRDATLKGWEYALAHPEEIVDRIVTTLPRVLIREDLVGLNLAQADQVARLLLSPTVQVGRSDPVRWDAMIGALRQSGMLTNPTISPDFFFEAKTLSGQSALLRATGIALAISLWVVIGLLIFSALIRRQVTARTADLRENEAALRQALNEKETLLREVHHRVKNNLQTISSLMYFYEVQAASAASREALAGVRSRLRAMILIHERLYRSANLEKIGLREYLGALATDLVGPTASNATKTLVRVGGDEISLPIEIALPCGMIVAELVTNAVKHAFSDRSEGMIGIDIQHRSARLTISVSDDGRGLPEQLDSAASFGWRLISSLAEQVDGVLEIERPSSGTRVTVSLPLVRGPRHD